MTEFDEDTGISISLNEGTVRRMVDDALEGIVARATQAVDARIREAVNNRIDTAAKDLVTEAIFTRIAARVEEVVADGWPRTNNYGERTGQPISLKERVSAMLMDKGYSSSQARIDKIVEEAVAKTMQQHLSAPIAEARKKYETLLDQKAMAAFGNLLRKALGVEA